MDYIRFMSRCLDRSARKASIAARLLRRKRAGRPFSARDRRLARALKNDPAVTDRLIHQALAYQER